MVPEDKPWYKGINKFLRVFMEDRVHHLLDRHLLLGQYLDHAFRIVLIIALVLIAAKLVNILIRGILAANRKKGASDLHGKEREKRLATVLNLVEKAIRITIIVLAFMMVLREFGVDITPLLTGAGIAGVALGFGSQSLVKDVISGFFILIEDQIRIGDVIRINNGLSGSVERMELRVTAIRDGDGTLHIIPNGEIKSVSNMTYDFAQAVIDLPLPYRADLQKVFETLNAVVDEFSKDSIWSPELMGKVRVVGIVKFEAGFMLFELSAKTVPHSRWSVSAELRKRAVTALQAAGVSLA